MSSRDPDPGREPGPERAAEPSGDAPLSRLVARGVLPEVATELIAADLYAEVSGQPMILAEGTEPVTGRRQVIVPFGAGALLGSPALLDDLLATCRARHPDATELVLALPAAAHGHRLAVGEPLLRYIRASADIPRLEPGDGWQVRHPVPADLPQVAELLRLAMTDGYRDGGDPPGPDVVAAQARSVLDRALDTGAVFVAVHDGEFAGHATLIRDADELTGQERWELFDMFVLPAWRGSVASRLLVAAAVGYAERSGGLPLRGQVSGHGEAADRVLERLVTSGWRPDVTYWRIELAGRAA